MATQVLETIEETITTYTGLSPTTFLTAVALALTIYYVISSLFGDISSDMQQQTRSSSFEEREPLPPPVQLAPMSKLRVAQNHHTPHLRCHIAPFWLAHESLDSHHPAKRTKNMK
ncbi:cytochrome b5-like heme/steroid binding domain-containing protein [Artemisia annua]|uniref:Cytochrome b5-like heme/steroid binding domain-containing protein n=1 Tax=Artemisia annua TaxID=35608 RepID=A0A2U1LGK8_ARTAN|nr:cytochrome b5-like heme/steroid binding domain-containing protein [Artemisia annua]